MPIGQGYGLLEQILRSLSTALNGGLEDIQPFVTGLLTLLMALAIVVLAYSILINGNALPSAIGFLVRCALVVWGINHWGWVLENLSQLAIQTGLLLTGGAVSVPDLMDPGVMIKRGIDSGAPLWRAFVNNSSWTSPVTGLGYLATYIVYLSAFLIASWRLFWIQAEMFIASVAGIVLLPTLLFRPTQFIASGCLSFAANSFARWLILSIIIGAMWTHFDGIPAKIAIAGTQKLDLTIQEAALSAAMAIILSATLLGSNALAGALTSGIPGMSGSGHVGTVIRNLSAGIHGLITAGSAGTLLGLGTARTLAGGMQGLVGAGQAAAAFRSGGVSSLGEAARQLYAGARQGASGGMQARLAQYMAPVARLGEASGQQAVHDLMAGRHGGGHDHMHRGAHR